MQSFALDLIILSFNVFIFALLLYAFSYKLGDVRWVEGVDVSEALYAVVIGQEAHARIERRCVARRLFAQQDLHRVGHRTAELVT